MAPKRSNRKIKRKLVKRAAITHSTYPSCILLHLPTELLVKILTYLTAEDLFSVRWTCRALGNVVTGTAYLQYIIHANINGVEDSLPPDFPYSERLELLRRHERSWNAPQFNLFTRCVTKKSHNPNNFILQDGYLIYQSLWDSEDVQQYGYTDLHSAARHEELRWVHITIDNSLVPLLDNVTFAIDHNLVVGLSRERLGDGDGFHLQLTFLEFTTGSFHPLSSTPTVSLPPIYGHHHTVVGAEVLGEHILVLLWNFGKTIAFYLLVSWKAGTVALVNGLDPHTTTSQSRRFKALVIDDNVFVLMKDRGNRLEVCKLEATSPHPCLQTICFLELPPLMPGVSVDLSRIFAEWVPTLKNYARSRSSRTSYSHFYSATVGTIALFLDYRISCEYRDQNKYALIIGVKALLDTMHTGVRNVPWADWGPSSTQLFKRTVLCSAGPFWITGSPWSTELSPPELHQYYPRRTRFTRSMMEDTSSSSRTGPQEFLSTEEPDELWVDYCIETNLPYRFDFVNDLEIGYVQHILADRVWFVGLTRISISIVERAVSLTVYRLE